MKRVRELEAWSVPGKLLPLDYGKTVLQPELWNEGVPRDVFLGTSNIPDPAHCEDLRLSIQSGELTESEFKEFCQAQGLPMSSLSEESACRFLEYIRGTCLAWIHLPDHANEALLAEIVEALRVRGHIVIDPENMVQVI